MAEMKLNTRVLLKYDTLANWNSSDLVLKAGEVAIATVPTTETTTKSAEGVITPPAAVVIKVGDGVSTFAQLPLISALAADVYGWAKKSEDEFKTWLDQTAGFATDAELASVKAALEAKDATLQEMIEAIEGGGEGSGSEGGLTGLYDRINDLETILSSFLPADDTTATMDAVKAAIDAVATSVSDLESSVNTKVEALEAADTGFDARLDAIEANLNGTGEEGSTGLAARVEALEGGLGDTQQDVADLSAAVGEVADGKTVVGMIGEAEQAAKDYADGKVSEVNASVEALDTEVKANTAAIGVLNGDENTAGSVKKTVVDEIAKVVNEAPESFDTLKEIADWIANDTTGAAAMANDIAALKNKDSSLEADIAELEAADQAINDRINAIVGTEGSTGTLAALESRVAQNETDITNLKSKDEELVQTLQATNAAVEANTAGVATNKKAIEDEVTRAEGAEKTILDSLNAEIERAEGAEKTIADALAEEASRADTAEKALSARLDALAPVATSGYINDLTQQENTEIILDCGNSAARVTVAEG